MGEKEELEQTTMMHMYGEAIVKPITLDAN